MPPAMHEKDFHQAADKDAQRGAIETSLLADPRFPMALSGAVIMAAVVGARVTDEDAAPARLAGAWFHAAYARITALGGNFSDFFQYSCRTRVNTSVFSSPPPASLAARVLLLSHPQGAAGSPGDEPIADEELDDIGLVVGCSSDDITQQVQGTGQFNARVGDNMVWHSVLPPARRARHDHPAQQHNAHQHAEGPPHERGRPVGLDTS
jgi:hypothetical protein